MKLVHNLTITLSMVASMIMSMMLIRMVKVKMKMLDDCDSQNMERDAKQFADWGVDYVKVLDISIIIIILTTIIIIAYSIKVTTIDY